MKHTKRIFAIFMSLAMVMTMMIAMSATVFADETSQHTITITNTDQNVSHTYKGYQIFVGKLDAGQTKLSDIAWGDDVDGDELLDALKASTDPNLLGDNPATTDVVETDWNLFTSCSSAKDVAKVFATFSDTSAAAAASGAIDAVAKIIAETEGVLTGNGVAFTEGSGDDAKTYTATVEGDGYYFIKDETPAASLKDETTKTSDTLSKYLLAVVKDTTIVAKDTGLNPDKEIVSGNERVKTGTAAVGDTVTFEVKVKVPDTRKYVDHFIFDMQDKLPKGLTFTGITSVKVGNDDVSYDLYINDTKQSPFTAPTDPVDKDAPTADTTVKLVFTNFKAFAEGKDGRIGSNLVVTYTAIVNKGANFTSTGNINEVVFDYSNDPNHDYDGDTPGPNEPMGVTPKDTTKTLLTNITIHKQGDKGQVANLAGAVFEITSSDYNVTLVTGEKFVASDYEAGDGETIVDGVFYKLKDGSYTTTEPTDATASSYDSTEVTYKKVTFSKAVTTPSGTPKKVTVTSGEDGNIKLEGLKPGTYTIQEIQAPSGYNLDSTTYTIKLDFNGNAIVLNTTDSSSGVTYTDNTATASLTIDNESGAVLPGTGGIGTVIFYVLGSALLIGCGVVLISKRRMTKEK